MQWYVAESECRANITYTYKIHAHNMVNLLEEAINRRESSWNGLEPEYRKILLDRYVSRTSNSCSWLSDPEDIQLVFQYYYKISCVVSSETHPD